MKNITAGEGIKNENCDNATIYIDTKAIKAWGVDEDGFLYIETDHDSMSEIADCAGSIVMAAD